MRSKHLLFLMMIFLLLASCSNKPVKPEAEGVSSEEADMLVDSAKDDLFDEDEEDEDEDLFADAGEEKPEEAVAAAEEQIAKEPKMVPEISGAIANYTVKKNETLMLIAFKLYGDYRKWKEFASWNPGIMDKPLVPGQKIKYYQPKQAFVWNPKGNPHLVKRGESLSIISGKVYGEIKRWPEIFENNKPMIRNPNLIFAGFTLYYIPDRDIASEKF